MGPEEPDPTEEPEVGCLGLLKFIVISLVVIILAGKFFTGSFLWEQELPDLSKLVPVRWPPRMANGTPMTNVAVEKPEAFLGAHAVTV